MPAPHRPNMGPALETRQRQAQEKLAGKLRAAGWQVTPPPPEQKTDGTPVEVRIVASPKRVAAFIAWLREHDGTVLRLLKMSDPQPRRGGGEVAVYAELVMLGPIPENPEQ